MKKTIIIIIAWLASLVLTEAFLQWRCKGHTDQEIQTDTVLVIKNYTPIATDSFKVGEIVGRFPVVYGIHDTITNTTRDTVIDSVAVRVPISKKIYSCEEYYAEVSGYEPNLDTLSIQQRTITQTMTNKPSRWALGITAGYGVTPKGLQPFVGVGIQYNIFTWPKRKTN